MSIRNPFMQWINQYVRPYLRERLMPLLEAEGAAAPKRKSGSSTRLVSPVGASAAGSQHHISKLSGDQTNSRAGSVISMDSLLLQQQQSAVLATALSAIHRRKASEHQAEIPSVPTQKQQHQHQATRATLKMDQFPSSAPEQQEQQQQVSARTKIQVNAPTTNAGAGVAAATATPASTAPSSPSSRFKRCYYVPVMNPLPDLKEKQLAVLEMPLYGIRDMPTFRELLNSLPPSVISTAKLRGLSLLQVPEMVASMEEQSSTAFLSAGDAFPLQEELGKGKRRKEVEGEEEEEEEGVVEREERLA